MTTKIEQEIEKLRQLLEKIQSQGPTINLYHGEGQGTSSAVIERKTKGDVIFSVKVYSNDLTGAGAAVAEALTQYKRLIDSNVINGDPVISPRQGID